MSTSCLSQLGFSYSIVRSKRKTAAIHVRGAQVEVRIPGFVDDQWAQDFLLSKQTWVRQKLAQQTQQNQLRPVLEEGRAILWLGSERKIQLHQRKGVELDEDAIVLGNGRPIPAPPEQTRVIQAMLESYFKQQAKRYMIARTWELARLYGLDHKLVNVVFRRTKTKWGHCTSKGTIQYNWLIMGAPKAVIDYLICHEVSHLRHPNHSQAFWRCVAQFCPDYKQHQYWLKQNSVALSWC
ncbi:MAG: putative metal-dependent hydrolase [Bermanella sp.]|jgi:predicted metal-dependent hydrolase